MAKLLARDFDEFGTVGEGLLQNRQTSVPVQLSVGRQELSLPSNTLPLGELCYLTLVPKPYFRDQEERKQTAA